MRLAQLKDRRGQFLVAATEGDGSARVVNDAWSVYALAMSAAASERRLAELVAAHGLGASVDLAEAYREGRLLPPITHPDPAHLYVTGTGLSHLGSAEGRDAMHKKLQDAASLTDSMKMFRMGLEGGKPRPGEAGIQPEWFYKGDGSIVAAPGAPLASPEFARDGGEEPEIVGIYLVGPDGAPCRIGFALGNEFADHVTERENYLYVTGTGLSHLGSAEGRDAMHKKLQGAESLTDSMKMFRMGLEGGKPRPGEAGYQPEWFYKGDGSIVAAPGAPLASPEFARDGGEEPEIVGIYLVGPDGAPCRIGFALGNEFADHVTERENYLWLAHSKLRPCSIGPELLLGELPADVRGASRILRRGETIWEKPFISGEENMSHSIANLEAHHFKYALFRRPGDVHVHFFGTATLSFSDNIRTEPGDVFEIEAAGFGLPLRNALEIRLAPDTAVRAL